MGAAVGLAPDDAEGVGGGGGGGAGEVAGRGDGGC